MFDRLKSFLAKPIHQRAVTERNRSVNF